MFQKGESPIRDFKEDVSPLGVTIRSMLTKDEETEPPHQGKACRTERFLEEVQLSNSNEVPAFRQSSFPEVVSAEELTLVKEEVLSMAQQFELASGIIS